MRFCTCDLSQPFVIYYKCVFPSIPKYNGKHISKECIRKLLAGGFLSNVGEEVSQIRISITYLNTV
jgi:hypothetical protein